MMAIEAMKVWIYKFNKNKWIKFYNLKNGYSSKLNIKGLREKWKYNNLMES